VRLRVLCALLLCSVYARPASATAITVLPEQNVVNVGDSFLVNVAIQDVTDLFGWQLDFAFDSSIFQLDTVKEGAFLATGGSTDFFEASNVVDPVSHFQTIELANTLQFFISGVSSSGLGSDILVTFGLTAIAVGTSSFDLANIFLSDSQFNQIAVDPVAPGKVESTPEPGTLLLVASGIATAWRFRRRARHNQEATKSVCN
jgi:hypothetical protein